MDNLLSAYLEADDRQQYLDELLMVYAAPIVRRTLRRKLGFYVSAQGVNPRNHEAEDLFQEAMTKIVQMLHDLQSSQSKTEVETLSSMLRESLRMFASTSYGQKHQRARDSRTACEIFSGDAKNW